MAADPYTGRTFELGGDLVSAVGVPPIGGTFELQQLQQRAEDLPRSLSHDEELALESRALVHVTGEAAQIGKVGERELERRRRRNAAAKRARRANR